MNINPGKYIRHFLSSPRWSVLTSSLDLSISRYRLGVTVADDSLRLALVKTGKKKPVFIDGEILPWPDDNSNDAWPARRDIIVEAILRILKKNSKMHAPVNIGMLGREIGLRRLNLPDMPSGELAEAVRWESNKLFPFDISQCILDHEIVGKSGANSDKLAVNITAASDSIISDLTQKLTKANINVGQINFLPAVLVEALRQKEAWSAGQASLILYLDRGQGMATFVRGGYIELHQDFIVQPIESSVGDGSLQNLNALMEELTSFLELYFAQGQVQNVDNVFMAGFFTENVSNCELFSEQLDMPVSVMKDFSWWPAFANIYNNPALPFLTTSLLTALVLPYPHRLAKPQHLDRGQRSQKAVCAITAIFLALLTATILYWTDCRTESGLNTTLSQLQDNISSIESSPGYLTYLSMTSKLALSNPPGNGDLRKNRSLYSLLLKELSLKIPPELNFRTLDISVEDGRYIMGIDGIVVENKISPEIILAQYVRWLDESPFFSNVEIISHGKKHSQGRFEVNFQIKMEVNS